MHVTGTCTGQGILLNNGPLLALRDRTVKKTGSYDLVTEAGKVKPKALDANTYAGMRN